VRQRQAGHRKGDHTAHNCARQGQERTAAAHGMEHGRGAGPCQPLGVSRPLASPESLPRFLATQRTDSVINYLDGSTTLVLRLRWSLQQSTSLKPLASKPNQECRRGGIGRRRDLVSLGVKARVSGAPRGLRPCSLCCATSLTAGTAAPCEREAAERKLPVLARSQ